MQFNYVSPTQVFHAALDQARYQGYGAQDLTKYGAQGVVKVLHVVIYMEGSMYEIL